MEQAKAVLAEVAAWLVLFLPAPTAVDSNKIKINMPLTPNM
jgi:hypothetical protein